MDTNFQLSSYRYELPDALIASQPLERRDESRLMVVHRSSRRIEHRWVRDLPQLLNENHVLVANNTQVYRARLLGTRVPSGGKVEFFLLKCLDHEGLLWQGLMKSSAKIESGFTFEVDGVVATVQERIETAQGATFSAKFSKNPLDAGIGEAPLPPYIVAKRKVLGESARADDQELEVYNTVYSKVVGSVAAPTAGRHFTSELIERLKAQGVQWNEITLHVGIGTFKPVSAADIREHQMHPEMATMTPEVASTIKCAKEAGKKIVAVGTTTARTLEGFALGESGTREVNLFIHPGSGHSWKVVDAMLTNFHLPESSLLMMIADFIGSREWTLALYQEAIQQQYRFYSYGDAMLIL